MEKKLGRLRRARRVRVKVSSSSLCRLSVHRTNAHIYAQMISKDRSRVLFSATSLGQKDDHRKGSTAAGAACVGKLIAERAVEQGIVEVVFDRGGFRYHGRVKALADAAREAGLRF